MARKLRVAANVAAATALLLVTAAPVQAQEDCTRSVVLALPGVLWSDIERLDPPNIVQAIEDGAWGSMSVRTNSSRTSFASGFVTMGAGARVDGGVTTGGPVEEVTPPGGSPVSENVRVAGVGEVEAGASDDGYGARPGALAGALEAPVYAMGNGDLGRPAPAPIGFGRWTLLSAMNPDGVVDAAATGDGLLDDDEAPYGVRTDPERLSDALDVFFEAEDCGVAFVDQGDLTRFDQWVMALGRDEVTGDLAASQREALMASDELLGDLRSRMQPDDLLLVVSPTSPSWAGEAHLGVAVAVGSDFEAGSALESASTRRQSLVTLPDVAPTILEHFGVDRPPEMNGRAMVSRPATASPVASMTALNDESVFIDEVKGPLNAIFVLFQVVVYVLLLLLLAWRERRGGVGSTAARTLQMCGLAVVAFPVSTYLAGVVDGHALGGVAFGVLLIAITVALVLTASVIFRNSLDRLLALVAFTWLVIALDLVTGSMLQLNTVFGYSPIVAGRFAGAGNIVFAVFGVTAVLTGALIAYRFSTRPYTMPIVVVLFLVTIIIDGAPAFGSDIGGVLALVPALGITLVLLSGRKPRVRTVVVAGVAGVVALSLFLIVDLALPAESQTHLARLYEDTRDRGFGALFDTIQRKATANLRVFTSTIWTYFVPPALLAMVYLLRRPSGRWQEFAFDYPKLRAGLIGGLVLAVTGFAVNDSGIVIPAVILSFLVPMALLVHLSMEASPLAGPSPTRKEVPA
ncbi:MAG TPA: hypothetical protein VFD47_00125 [Actinomycetota bacterium]|nr:hypothetical protein [Actinomycetota bacterium]